MFGFYQLRFCCWKR